MSNVKNSLGDRMKKYERVSKNTLVSRMPVIIRLDGKAFHTFTRGFEKPFDEVLIHSMQKTMFYLCSHIQGCRLGYCQSDEITLVLCDYNDVNTCAWFDNEVQKICSVAASMATLVFNKAFELYVIALENGMDPFDNDTFNHYKEKYTPTEFAKLINRYYDSIKMGAMFDCRVFNVPVEEVTNCVLWRQNDATRNSIQMVGQTYFSHKELQNKTCNMIQDMLHEQKGINWNDFPIHQKRGTCCAPVKDENGHTKWIIDRCIPIFKEDGREYIEKLIHFN